jgi:hypothetical protein
MGDDWRLRIEMADGSSAIELTRYLRSGGVEHELDDAFSDRVIVSVDDAKLLAYAGSREQAEHAAQTIHALSLNHGWRIDQEHLERWHPVAEAWEDPDKPLPGGEAEVEAEREEQIASEHADEAAEGYPEWEVRVECHSHHDTIALADKLEAEGLQSVRRWRYLLLGALDEDSARELAHRLKSELLPGCTVTVEGSLPAVTSGMPPNPFAVLGGLGL